MRSRSLLWRVPFAAVGLLLIAGCTPAQFVYKPNAPAVSVLKLPVKLAVLPFEDGTEDFTQRGSLFVGDGATFNLAKTSVGNLISVLTPALWAKFFADDTAASGEFQAARFIYGTSELADEEFYIDGTVEKAYANLNSSRPSEFALGLRALRRADNRMVWKKNVTRTWMNKKEYMADDANRVMREMFAEARADLVATLASLSGNRAGEGGLPPAASPGEVRENKGTSKPQTQESTEQTIDRILKGK